LSKKSIAAAADSVIAGYEAKKCCRVQPPIPVENLIERGLGLRLGFADLRKSLKLDDVLGATFINKKMICVDRSLTENQNEGRLCFTFAHETGHWVLHRKLVDQACRTVANRAFTRLRHNRTKSPALADFEHDLDQAIGPNGFGAVSPINSDPYMGGFTRLRHKRTKSHALADFEHDLDQAIGPNGFGAVSPINSETYMGGFTRLRYNKTKSPALADFEHDLDQAIGPDGFGAVSPNDFEKFRGGFIFCRVKNAKEPIEWQADYFASCLLMPDAAVRSAFGACFGSRPLILYNVKSAYSGPVCFDPCVETWPKIADAVREVGNFSNVSRQAMIIRLQDLGLVKNETRVTLSWKESHTMV